MEQGLFAFSNFFLSLLLARWLDPQDYGVFTVAYSIFLFLATIHTSLFTEPILVFGSGRFHHHQSAYFRTLLEDHGRFIFLSGLTVLTFGILFGLVLGFDSSRSFIALGIASPFILTLWLLRRMCYLRQGPHLAAQAGLIYSIFILGGSLILQHFLFLTPSTAFVLIALSSLCSTGWLIFKLQCVSLLRNGHHTHLEFRTAHWDYGRWALGTNVLTWLPSNIYFFALPLWVGLEAGGALRALLNFLMPIMHLFTALGSTLIPFFVGIRSRTDFTITVFKITGLLIFSSLLYWMILFLYGTDLMDWVYAGKFNHYGDSLAIIGILPILYSIHLVFSSALRALEKPSVILRASLISTIATLSLGLWMVSQWEVIGAQLGWLVSYMVGTALIIGYFLKLRSMHKLQDPILPKH
ncbi:MAG: lipopolysaccharide biosynthesis protein [Nitrospirales bacterium]